MYKKIKTKPEEAKFNIYTNGLIFNCDNEDYFFVNFKKLIKDLDYYYTTDSVYEQFYIALRKLGFSKVNYDKIITPQWSLCSFTVNGIEDAFVIYSDSYTSKVRINFDIVKTDNYYVEQDEEQKSILYFICETGVISRIHELEKRKRKLSYEITILKSMIGQ